MTATTTNVAIGIHGGCGVMPHGERSTADWASARQDLVLALQAGWALLVRGASAVDAVEAAVVVMENSPHFNAGYGAALNCNGHVALDASIMDGSTLGCGAVSAAERCQNPVRLARRLMDAGDVVMLTGPAADRYAQGAGLDVMEPAHFVTDRQRQALARMKGLSTKGLARVASESEKHGTVGAVAMDRDGHLAAATSTGGYTNKPEGRVGDSPIIGAGTYARNGACAVSGTGAGEMFIRRVVGHDVASRMAYLGESLGAAAEAVLGNLTADKVGAGLVAIDCSGTVIAPYNTAGMYRGWVTTDGNVHVATHDEVFFVATWDRAG
ncbi:isoaspartyl peptidase/L-asparaginase [Acidisoma cellulosilytica]|uniref:Isoaspartyl peptidase n=1 Tax=Acidisoma cellulosilyticum TaxID=2802395 RepID=A0A963Z675_9PROT|nr:isoaspartyl peptidase/L-asparaginase [Acidisoma cellulosilyticum]MCB8882563.1 isoaspartyl peptidase/L-asparaginase [Acidisoma cellulosilyticum]